MVAMEARRHILITKEAHRLAKIKAGVLDVTMTEYISQLVLEDVSQLVFEDIKAPEAQSVKAA